MPAWDRYDQYVNLHLIILALGLKYAGQRNHMVPIVSGGFWNNQAESFSIAGNMVHSTQTFCTMPAISLSRMFEWMKFV